MRGAEARASVRGTIPHERNKTPEVTLQLPKSRYNQVEIVAFTKKTLGVNSWSFLS